MLPRVDLIKTDEFDYLLLNSSDHISQYIKKEGYWGGMVSSIGKALTIQLDNAVVIDAGANIGSFTLPLAKHLQDLGGVVHSFEPQRIVFQQLCANIFINRLDNVYTYNKAVADVAANIQIPELDFSLSQNIGGFSIDESIRDAVDAGNAGTGYANVHSSRFSKFEVPQILLDSLGLFERVAFIKVDIEGLELEFFRGADETIRKNNFPPILFEVWNKEWYAEKAARTKKHLLDMGYKLEAYGREILAQHPMYYRQLESSGEGEQLKFKVLEKRKL